MDMPTVLDEASHGWEVVDAYISVSQSLVIILKEGGGVAVARLAIVTFFEPLDFRSLSQNESTPPCVLTSEPMPEDQGTCFRLSTTNRAIEVVSHRSPNILLKAPFEWLAATSK